MDDSIAYQTVVALNVSRLSGKEYKEQGQRLNTEKTFYAVMIIAHFGIVLYFFNLVTLLMFFLALIPAIVLGIFVE
jgi:hypothetical protein